MANDPLGAALAAATLRLAAGSASPRLDAELLMAHALGLTRDDLLLGRGGDVVPPEYDALVRRRAGGEPIAYIVGRQAFWTIDLAVGPGALIPRGDSETLVEAALAHFAGRPGPRRILDLGTGSGALLLAALAEWPDASGVGVDASAAAIRWARTNAERLGMADRARIVPGGWAGTGEAFDLILCNPPYIGLNEPLPRDVAEHEPASALYAGADGLDDYRALAPLLPGQLAAGGVACVEIGWTQAEAVAALFRAAGLAVTVRRDLAGRERCLVLTRAAEDCGSACDSSR